MENSRVVLSLQRCLVVVSWEGKTTFRRSIMRSTLVFVMVLVSSPALYAEDRGEKKEVKGWTIRGRVIDIDVPRDADEKRKSLGYLHVEDKDGEVLIDVRTTTLIEEGPEGKRKPVKFSEIK